MRFKLHCYNTAINFKHILYCPLDVIRCYCIQAERLMGTKRIKFPFEWFCLNSTQAVLTCLSKPGLFVRADAFKFKAAYKQGTKMYCRCSVYVDLNCLLAFICILYYCINISPENI